MKASYFKDQEAPKTKEQELSWAPEDGSFVLAPPESLKVISRLLCELGEQNNSFACPLLAFLLLDLIFSDCFKHPSLLGGVIYYISS